MADAPDPAPPRVFSPRWRWISGTALVAVVVTTAIVIAIASTSPTLTGSPGGSVTGGSAVSGSNGVDASASGSALPGGSASATPDTPAATGATGTDPTTPVSETTPIDAPAESVPGVKVSIQQLEAIDGVARTPGEIGGPAVRFTVSVENTTSAPVSLATLVVTFDYGADRTPAAEIAEPGGSPLPAEVAAGATATGVYLFTIAPEDRSQVSITVDYSVDVPPVVFSGPAPA